MPFVQRVVQPKYLSRAILHTEDGKPTINDGELEAVTNHTLSNALKQLASVMLIANEIFEELNKQLKDITERTSKLKCKISAVEEKVAEYDPKLITVPESNLTSFSELRSHFSSKQEKATEFFTQSSRPIFIQRLYEAAAKTPISVLERLKKNGHSSATYFSCTPVLSTKRRRYAVDIDIETRTPAVLTELRPWTSTEALGDMTVDPDCTNKISSEEILDSIEHRLPSPEEQLQALALKFPAEVVPVDVSGRSFQRMSVQRRSLMLVDAETGVVRRRRNKKVRGKRRNTIAGTDQKELEAIVYDSSDANFGKSEDIESSSDRVISEKKSHLDSLKEWGRARLRLIRSVEPAVVKLRERAGSVGRRKWDKEEPPYSSSGNWSASSESGHSTSTSHIPRSSISSGSMCPKHGRRPTMVSTSSSVTSESTITADDGETCSMYSCDTEGYYTSFHLDSGLKTLREEEPVSALHSSSALSGSRCNNSALNADSEYELFGKGSTSTTASSAGTVCTTLLIPPTPPNVPERKNSQLSSSKLPERNVQSLNNLAMTSKSTDKLERETQSLKMDRKISEISQFICSEDSNRNDKPSQLTKANVSKLKDIDKDYLKEKGIITVDVHHNDHLVSEIEGSPEKCGDSPDSGHNTCSSPVDSITSPSIDMEMSECSDLEGLDRIDRINRKTVINSSRIPSMCVITPPQSDDEISLKQAMKPLIDAGDYVTIADIKQPATFPPVLIKETEYVSLNELNTGSGDSVERKRKGARVTLDSEGKVVYSSESLRRRKQIHTTNTFEPGPNVLPNNSPLPHHRAVIANVRPICMKNSPLPARIKQVLAGSNNTPKTDTVSNLEKSAKSDENLKNNLGSKSAEATSGNVISNMKSSSSFSSNVGSLPRSVAVKSSSPLILTCSGSQSRNMNVPSGKQIITQANGKQIVSPKSPNQRPLSPLVSSDPSVRRNILISSNSNPNQQVPVNKRESTHASRSNSPSVFSSNSRSSSPKTIVKAAPTVQSISPVNFKGAYVRMQEPTDCLETCLDDPKMAVKRSDSYRLANDKNAGDELSVFNPNSLGRRQRGVNVTAGPNLLVAIKTSHNNQKDCEDQVNATNSQSTNSSLLSETGTWPRRSRYQSTSTPTKGNAGQLNFSSNISPISASQSQKSANVNGYMPKSHSTDFQSSLNARDRFYNNYLGSLAQMYNNINYNNFKRMSNVDPGLNHNSSPTVSTMSLQRSNYSSAQNPVQYNPLRNRMPSSVNNKNCHQNRPLSPPNTNPTQVYSQRASSPNQILHPAIAYRNRSPSPLNFSHNRAASPNPVYQSRALSPSSQYQTRSISPANYYQNKNPNNQYSNRALSPSSQYPKYNISSLNPTISSQPVRYESDGRAKIPNQGQNMSKSPEVRKYPHSIKPASNILDKNSVNGKVDLSNAYRDLVPKKIDPPIQRPRSATPTRNGMDLYAVIHESKKRIKALQTDTSPEDMSPQPLSPNTTPQNVPTKDPFVNLSHIKSSSNDVSVKLGNSEEFNRIQLTCNNLKPMTEKFGPSMQTSRYDFKKLLLRTGWGSNRNTEKVSAVERLKNKISPEKQVKESKFSVVDRLRERTPTPRKKHSWKSDILSSTILEDCAEDEEPNKKASSSDEKVSNNQSPEKRLSSYLDKDLAIPKSSALVSQQLKAFSQNSPSSSSNDQVSLSRKSPTGNPSSRSHSKSPSSKTPTLETSL